MRTLASTNAVPSTSTDKSARICLSKVGFVFYFYFSTHRLDSKRFQILWFFKFSVSFQSWKLNRYVSQPNESDINNWSRRIKATSRRSSKWAAKCGPRRSRPTRAIAKANISQRSPIHFRANIWTWAALAVVGVTTTTTKTTASMSTRTLTRPRRTTRTALVPVSLSTSDATIWSSPSTCIFKKVRSITHFFVTPKHTWIDWLTVFPDHF